MTNFTISRDNFDGEYLQYTLFENLDYRVNYKSSFRRVDFRGSKFQNCYFCGNDFDRSDFIDCYFDNVEIIETNLGICLFKNAYFHKVLFRKNIYQNVAFQSVIFEDCEFSSESIIATMYNCKFINCTFNFCDFSKSAIDSNSFYNCYINSSDMAQCHMENIKFDSCIITKTAMGFAYIPTYLLRHTAYNDISWKSHGQLVTIDSSVNELAECCYNNKQFFHYLNLLIIFNNQINKDIYTEVSKVFEYYTANYSILCKNDIVNILDMLEFYFSYDKIDIIAYMKIIQYLNEYNFAVFPLDTQLECVAIVHKINKRVESMSFDLQYIRNAPITEQCAIKLHINTDDKDFAVEETKKIFQCINNSLLNDAIEKDKLCEIIDIEKGSIILTITSALIVALLASKVIKEIRRDLMESKIQRAYTEKAVQEIRKKKNLPAASKTYKTAINTLSADNPKYLATINKISNSLLIGEIISIIIGLII